MLTLTTLIIWPLILADGHNNGLPDNMNIIWKVGNGRLSFSLATLNTGYISIGIAETHNMDFAELIAITKIDGGLFLFEYEGAAMNTAPLEKTDPGSWIIDEQSINGDSIEITISRLTNPTDCSICKDVNAHMFILWATGTSYPTTGSSSRVTGSLSYHGSQLGSLGRHALADSMATTTTVNGVITPTSGSTLLNWSICMVLSVLLLNLLK